MKILTNHPGRVASPSWRAHATYLQPAGNAWAASTLAVRLYRRRLDHDCVILGAGKSDLAYALLQTLAPFRRKPTIMIDCLWYERRNPIVQAGKVLLMKIADRSIDRYCVWASREIEAYSTAFGLNRDKFVFIPYHTTLDGHDLPTSDGDYLFAGGSSGRDYRPLVEAMKGVPMTLHIACTTPRLFRGLTLPPNVVVRPYDPKEYLRAMAGCTANIVALAPGLLHSAGQQTFLNSMWLGKPTIVTDPGGARDYIEHGIDGLLVEPDDPNALREAILTLLSDRAAARRMGERARQKALTGYSTEDHFRRIIALAAALTGQPAGAPIQANAPQLSASSKEPW